MTYRGVGCHWGTSSTTSTTITGQVQTRDHDKQAEMEPIKNGDGTTVGKVYYDHNEKCTFNWIPTQATLTGTMNPSLPAIGDLVTLTDAVYTAVAGTNWIVEKVSTKSANNGAMKIDMELAKFPSITT